VCLCSHFFSGREWGQGKDESAFVLPEPVVPPRFTGFGPSIALPFSYHAAHGQELRSRECTGKAGSIGLRKRPRPSPRRTQFRNFPGRFGQPRLRFASTWFSAGDRRGLFGKPIESLRARNFLPSMTRGKLAEHQQFFRLKRSQNPVCNRGGHDSKDAGGRIDGGDTAGTQAPFCRSDS